MFDLENSISGLWKRISVSIENDFNNTILLGNSLQLKYQWNSSWDLFVHERGIILQFFKVLYVFLIIYCSFSSLNKIIFSLVITMILLSDNSSMSNILLSN